MVSILLYVKNYFFIPKKDYVSKNEAYYIIGLASKGKEQSILIDYDTWINLSIGQTVKLKVFIFGSDKLIE